MITFIIKNKDVTTQHKLEYDKNIKFNDVINNLNLNEYNYLRDFLSPDLATICVRGL